MVRILNNYVIFRMGSSVFSDCMVDLLVKKKERKEKNERKEEIFLKK